MKSYHWYFIIGCSFFAASYVIKSDVVRVFEYNGVVKVEMPRYASPVSKALMEKRPTAEILTLIDKTDVKDLEVRQETHENVSMLTCSLEECRDTFVCACHYQSRDINNIKSWTPLMFAAAFAEDAAVIDVLIDKGADLYAKALTTAEENALQIALRHNKNPEIIKALVRHGADINEPFHDERNALDMAIAFQQGDDVGIMKAVLDSGFDVNTKNKDGLTPLMKAIEYKKSAAVIKTLLAYGVDFKIVDNKGKTAVAYAFDKYEHCTKAGIMKALEEAGADVSITFEIADVLMWKEIHKHGWDGSYDSKTLLELLAKGANPNSRDRGKLENETAFLYALDDNFNLDVIRAMLEAGADMSLTVGKRGVLYFAVDHKNAEELIELLFEKYPNANVFNADDYYEAMVKASRGTERVKLLLNKKMPQKVKNRIVKELATGDDRTFDRLLDSMNVDVNVTDDMGRTALFYAKEYERNKKLINHKADIRVRDKYGMTAVDFVASTSELSRGTFLKHSSGVDYVLMNNSQTELNDRLLRMVENSRSAADVQALIIEGAYVYAEGMDDRNAMDILLERDAYLPEMFEALIKAGYDVNHRDKLLGFTALMRIFRNDKVKKEWVELLLKNGAKVNIRDYKWQQTPLILSIYSACSAEITGLLLKAGAEVDAEDSKGQTALMRAIQSGNVEKALLLLEAGADIYHKNKAGDTIFDLAELNDKMFWGRYYKSFYDEDEHGNMIESNRVVIKPSEWIKMLLEEHEKRQKIKAGD